MSDFIPTGSQRAAIETKGRTVLVSAAAGSGKTKVLTERVLARISEDADIDSFLIITFTKAAAAELRGRITEEISKRLEDEPDNRRLRRQNALVQKAHIGTIHSFCAALLRENCHEAGLSPEFKVIEEDRAEAHRRRVIERVLDESYEHPSEDFLLLTDTVGRGRDDARLKELVLSMHKRLQSHARPEKWARTQVEKLTADTDNVADTVWGGEVLEYVRTSAAYWADCFDELAAMCAYEEKVNSSYGEKLRESALMLRDFVRASENDWDSAFSMLPIKLPDFRSGPRKTSDPELLEHIKEVRKQGKKCIEKYPTYISAPSSELLCGIKSTAPAMRALTELISEFDRAYSKEKRRRSELDFSDLEHMTVELLTDENEEATPLAKELSGRFSEIMVDEYQDVNTVQDCIFRALSRDGRNLFMVGDVKQSIYRFRLADPIIFTKKYLSYSDIDAAESLAPVRITLSENFRSRSEIIDAANHVFETCMSEKLGELDYDDKAKLRCGADYEGNVPVPELMLVDVKSDDDEDTPDKTELEALAVAEKINELIDSGACITDHGTQRPLRYGDIAILMRSANTVGGAYARVLGEAGIPVMNGQGGGYFTSVEVSSVVCLLAVIDNPHQDIPLISALRSPMFGFSADELSEIRAASKNTDFWTALIKAAEVNEKCAAFTKKLRGLRECSHDMELGEFMRHVYEETDALAVCSALSGGMARCTRLMQLLGYARRFESTGFKSLHRFVSWLNELAERGDEPGTAAGGNAVRIMTVHRSKGLEFPVVFLCDTSRSFNRSDLREPVLMHRRLGFGPKLTDVKRGIEYPTLAQTAVRLCLEREMLSEEMRLLYVALTRARERLFITGALKTPEKKLADLQKATLPPVSPELLSGASSPLYWLMQSQICDERGSMKLSIVHPGHMTETESGTTEAQTVQENRELTDTLRRMLAYRYPHQNAKMLPSKLTATELKKYDEPDPEAADLAPKTVRSFRYPELNGDADKLTGTEKGIATHTLLQYIDYAKARTEEGIRAELKRLTDNKQLTERQARAVELGTVLKLFNSELGERIMNADRLVREFRFSILCPAEEFFTGGEGEKVLLQGVIDCCIEENGELTVIDYKTDRVRGEALHERAALYKSQVKAYAAAVERMTGKPVKECVLYFLHAGEAVIL